MTARCISGPNSLPTTTSASRSRVAVLGSMSIAAGSVAKWASRRTRRNIKTLIKTEPSRSVYRSSHPATRAPFTTSDSAPLVRYSPRVRIISIAFWCVLAAACARPTPQPTPDKLIFLTREGCHYSALMRARLDAALRTLGRQSDYAVINADDLPTRDPWRSYGTPSILLDRRDLFGLPEPAPSETTPT